jgi:hypothetical protein
VINDSNDYAATAVTYRTEVAFGLDAIGIHVDAATSAPTRVAS